MLSLSSIIPRVKLAMDDNGNLYAIKRYKKETANLSDCNTNLELWKYSSMKILSY